MKATFKVRPNLVLEIESRNQKDLFEELATAQEVFGQSKCEACGSTDVKFVVREVEDNKYYELQCQACRAKLAFGCHKKTPTLFPKRKGDDGKFVGKFGWVKWDGTKKTDESPPQ